MARKTITNDCVRSKGFEPALEEALASVRATYRSFRDLPAGYKIHIVMTSERPAREDGAEPVGG